MPKGKEFCETKTNLEFKREKSQSVTLKENHVSPLKSSVLSYHGRSQEIKRGSLGHGLGIALYKCFNSGKELRGELRSMLHKLHHISLLLIWWLQDHSTLIPPPSKTRGAKNCFELVFWPHHPTFTKSKLETMTHESPSALPSNRFQEGEVVKHRALYSSNLPLG